MGSSGESEHGSSESDSGEGPSASAEQPLVFIDPNWPTASLSPEFAQRLTELMQMVRDAQERTLTVAEQQAVATLIKALRALLGADER